MSAYKSIRKICWVIFLICCPFILWNVLSPIVAINFHPDNEEEINYTWIIDHRTHRGTLQQGGSAVEYGDILPSNDFFMVFFWWNNKGFIRCIDITPKQWRSIDIYLDEKGKIDIAKTGPDVIARLKQCDGEQDPFRP